VSNRLLERPSPRRYATLWDSLSCLGGKRCRPSDNPGHTCILGDGMYALFPARYMSRVFGKQPEIPSPLFRACQQALPHPPRQGSFSGAVNQAMWTTVLKAQAEAVSCLDRNLYTPWAFRT
jgi:hypothetical protein